MYPTKSFDQEQRQAEHVRRHLEVLNAAYGDPGISGAIGWCAFDYNTHKDFGAGDRICHHGVMDMFREPKFAAYAYASQCEPAEEVILEPVTFWARGERNIGGMLPLIVLTNCDEVELTLRQQSAQARRPRSRDLPAFAASAGGHRPPPLHRRRARPVGHAVARREDRRLCRRQAGEDRAASPPIRSRRRLEVERRPRLPSPPKARTACASWFAPSTSPATSCPS